MYCKLLFMCKLGDLKKKSIKAYTVAWTPHSNQNRKQHAIQTGLTQQSIGVGGGGRGIGGEEEGEGDSINQYLHSSMDPTQ